MKLLIKKIKVVKRNEIKVNFKKSKKTFLEGFLNIFRRFAISNQTKFSPCWIKIKNVKHEYGVIDGVEEDTLNLVTNLRKLIFRLKNCNSIVIKVKKKGLCFLKGEDFFVKDFCYILNGDSVIAKIKEDKVLNIKIKIKKSKDRKLYFFPKKKKESKIYIKTFASNLKFFSYKVKENGESYIFLKTNGMINPLFFFLKIHRRFFLNFHNKEKYMYEKLFLINPEILKPVREINNKIINNLLNNTNKPLINFFVFKSNMIQFECLKSNLKNIIRCEFRKTGIFF
ncbi:DNA-directed RNA polymerase alpha subunit [Candidatus Vidania fulgoroideae]|nr:DNA-directed RNA polymerase alpha subunit [Candidatus Vidania fulgoroideae]